MQPAVTVALLSLGAVALLGAALTVAAPRLASPAWWDALAVRVTTVVDGCSASLGRLVTAAVVLLAGFGATLLTCYLLGEVAHELERSVDVPLFVWFQDRQLRGTWTHLWSVLTQMGTRRYDQLLALVGGLTLALIWARERRRWWVPLVMLPAGYLFEKVGQMFIKLMVHRGHPPTTLGTWPSGGCARLTVVFGLIIYLALRGRGLGRRQWLAGWSVLAFLAAVEGYSRTYLLKHWFTDVLGGLIYGTLALAVLVAAISVLDRRPSSRTWDREPGYAQDETGRPPTDQDDGRSPRPLSSATAPARPSSSLSERGESVTAP